MASTYNGSVANLVDPLSTSLLSSPSHAGQHTEINDALQTLGTYTAFTPSWTNLTVGNATQNFRFTQYNKMVHYYGQLTFGSTTSITGVVSCSLPVIPLSSTISFHAGIGYEDTGNQLLPGYGFFQSNALFLCVANVAGTYPSLVYLSATVPYTWVSTDRININIVYEAA